MRELFDEASSQSDANPMQAARRSARAVQRKRFYKDAGVGVADGGFTVTLDGKPIKTPSGRMVVVPCARLAEMIAAEWNAQGELIDPLTMPLTRFANSVVQGVVDQTEAVADDVARYFASDLAVLSRWPSRRAGGARGAALGHGPVLGKGRARRAFHARRRRDACPPARRRDCGGTRGAARAIPG